MNHNHEVYDDDKHFTINIDTRELKIDGKDKMTIMQGDHDSERITFDIPKTIEGHNMLDCNVVEVHYLNIEDKGQTQIADLYTVKDLETNQESEDMVTFSWLISENATQLIGRIFFRITFKCVTEQGDVTYRWSTAIFDKLYVGKGISNTNYIVERDPDVIAQIEARLDAIEHGGGSGYTLPVATAEQLGGVKAVAATEEMTEEVGIDAEGKLKVKPGGGSDVAWFNVKDYGAKGDGVTNDAPAIRAAIEALPESNFVLYFPPGVYMQGDGTNPHYPLDDKGHYSGDNEIGEPIYFRFEKKSNFQILGFGAVIQAHPDNSCIVNNRGFDFDMCNDGTIAGLTYIGNIETRKPGGGDNARYNNQNAFQLTGCNNIALYRVNAIGAVMDGFTLGWSREYVGAPLITCDYIKLDGCKSLYSYRQGMSVVGGHHGVARDCDFSHTATIYGTSPRDGVDLEDPDAGGEDGWLFSGCRFENNAGTGIAVSVGARNTVIDSCYFTGSGVYVGQYAEEGTAIKNCLFENANVTIENYCTFEGNYLRSNEAHSLTCTQNIANDNIAQHVRNNTFHWNWDVAAEDFSSGYAATGRGVGLRQPNLWFEGNTLINPSGSNFVYAPYGLQSLCNNTIESDYDISAHEGAFIGGLPNSAVNFRAIENHGNEFFGAYRTYNGVYTSTLNPNDPKVIETTDMPMGNGNIIEFTLCKTSAIAQFVLRWYARVEYLNEVVYIEKYANSTTKTRLATKGRLDELTFSDIYEEDGYYKLAVKKTSANYFSVKVLVGCADGPSLPIEKGSTSYTVRAATEADDAHNFTNPPVYTVDGAGNVEILV